MRTKSQELLAVGLFGSSSRLGDRIEMLLRRGREFSPRASLQRVAASAILLLALGIAGSLAPRWIAFAQTPSFEVASVKPNNSGGGRFAMNPLRGGRFTASNVTLAMLISTAYSVQEFQISGGPSWLKSDHFDIEAKAEGEPGLEQFRPMLQSLLADRFQLKVRHDSKELPIYVLTVAKNGSKLKEAECAGEPSPANPCGGFSMSIRGDAVGRSVIVSQLALALTRIMGRPVRDQTGLAAKYNVDLHWTPDQSTLPGIAPPPGDAGLAPPDPNGPTIFTAIEEQLGLKLESAKGPVEMIVIDRAEKPDAN